MTRRIPLPALLTLGLLLLAGSSQARNPYKRAFFSYYPSADNTQLTDLPSNSGHCGVCHFDFDGSATRNAYGLGIETRLAQGLSIEEAIAELDGLDPDNDGFTTAQEIDASGYYSNTPTFPGLALGNYTSSVNVDLADLEPYLTPTGATDEIDPVVTVLTPAGGEAYEPNTTNTVSWTATDDSGIAHINLYLSDDGGDHWRQLARALPPTGSHDLFIPNLPGSNNTLKVEAYDNAGNEGEAVSAGTFTINAVTTGIVPTSLRDFDMPGTQPFEASVMEDPSITCIACHGDYDPDAEPYHGWQGSMMGQAMRDPVYLATLAVANEAAPGSGDLCLRCHTPGGWSEGRSFDTTGGMMNAKDFQGVQCDFCHRQVDVHYQEGVSPATDAEILAELESVPGSNANGQFVIDGGPAKRGPYADAVANHQTIASDFTLSANLCGTCHDVSNPAFIAGSEPGLYEVDPLNQAHPTADTRDMFPVERTFSEWSVSEYATSGGVYQPQFAGNKPDGMVATCQDCHMADVLGSGCTEAAAPTRSDLGFHDLTGGNTFVPDILPIFYPDEVDPIQLWSGKVRAQSMLSLAATMELTSMVVDGHLGLNVRLYNETGHKLPSGYPEGRRAWINVQAFDGGGELVYESGAYDGDTGILEDDADAKIYHIEPGISSRLSPVLGLPAGPSFHFALNDTVYLDNRIPPRGFTNAAFTEVQSPPVGYSYEDGQYWDDTVYVLPGTARFVEVTFYYQSISKEYIEFLRDNNTVNTMGQQLYDAWNTTGKSTPEPMCQAILDLDVSGVDEGAVIPHALTLAQNYPNPFNPQTWIDFSLAKAGPVSLNIYDGRGHLVRSLVNENLDEGPHQIRWDGNDDAGQAAASGVYHYVLKTHEKKLARKMTLLR